uniref:Hemicentin-1 n=1 Tax=Romanomermis culicivorax TaxID=13658 RepID=A0A915L4Z4_ROMCU
MSLGLSMQNDQSSMITPPSVKSKGDILQQALALEVFFEGFHKVELAVHNIDCLILIVILKECGWTISLHTKKDFFIVTFPSFFGSMANENLSAPAGQPLSICMSIFRSQSRQNKALKIETTVQTRTRLCRTYGQCSGAVTESKTCQCQITASWSDWSPWSKCVATCGTGGQQTRTRSCSQYGKCSGSASETQQCSTYVPCAVWSPWSAYGACSVTCNSGTGDRGTQTRSRTCSVQGGCLGSDTETMPCGSYVPCPSWSAWGQWGSCLVSCGAYGSGTMTRTRTCSVNNMCQGQGTDTQPCVNLPPCATWSQWTPWSKCSATCGAGGTQTRTRQCSIFTLTTMKDSCMPNCIRIIRKTTGQSSETNKCQSYVPCATWGDWGAWSDCSKPCGGGQSTRTRTCKPDNANCVGDKSQSQDCNKQTCAQWGDWGAW